MMGVVVSVRTIVKRMEKIENRMHGLEPLVLRLPEVIDRTVT